MTSWSMNPRALSNGTVLFLGISYERARTADTRGRTEPKVYTYVALKQAGVWFFSGSGRVPQSAGWGAVENWLERDGRKLEWVKIVSELKDVYSAPLPASPVAELTANDEAMASSDSIGARCPHHPDEPGSEECHFDSCSGCGGYHCGWRCEEMFQTGEEHGWDQHGVSGHEL